MGIGTELQQHLLSLSALQLAEVIRKGDVTSVDVIQIYLTEAKRVNSHVNAIVQFNPCAEAEAAELDEYMKVHKKPLGPLHGVPITVKEHIAVCGLKHTYCSPVLEHNVAETDSTIVKRLKAAGAIILGSTNMSELGLSYDTANALYGATRNPHNLQRSAGGSSGGEGAIIAGGGSVLGIGGDGGGGIRVPSNYNGILGLRPTRGRVPMTGVGPGARKHLSFLDRELNTRCFAYGPMGRFVDDLDLALSIISGPDLIDPLSLPAYEIDSSRKVDLSQLRVAYYVESGSPLILHTSVVEVMDIVVDHLSPHVLSISNRQPKTLSRAVALCSRVWGKDGGEGIKAMRSQYGEYPPHVQWYLDFVANSHITTRQEVEQLIRDWDTYCSETLSFFNDVDVLITPVSSEPALFPDSASSFDNIANTLAYSLAHLPTMVVGGLHVAGAEVDGADIDQYAGLPVGVQLVAPPYREDILLAVARVLEKHRVNIPLDPALNNVNQHA